MYQLSNKKEDIQMKKEYFQAVSKESMLLFIRTLEDQGFRLIDFRENMAGLKLGDRLIIVYVPDYENPKSIKRYLFLFKIIDLLHL